MADTEISEKTELNSGDFKINNNVNLFSSCHKSKILFFFQLVVLTDINVLIKIFGEFHRSCISILISYIQTFLT